MASEQLNELVLAARKALGMTQEDFAIELASSKRTVARWEAGEAEPGQEYLEALASLLYPRDRGFAARVAAVLGKTLVQLGLEPPPAPAPAQTPITPTLEHLADALVCAAAESSGTTPQAARAALLAAFERARAMGLSVEGACRGLRARGAPSAPESRVPSPESR